jgi:gliding motility-associated-like protein
VCYGQPSVFSGMNLTPGIEISQWIWSLGNGATRVSMSPEQEVNYMGGGEYEVQLVAVSKDGCRSSAISKVHHVYQTFAFAGNDTVVATGQPLMLNGSGGEVYTWTPSTGLSAVNIPNPVATLERDAQYVLTASTAGGCETRDTISIKVYDGPALYVPSAFSPNNDGHNDLFRFIAVGMRSVDFFQVYNRYGQLVYSSTNHNAGWDGTINGHHQPTGTYVWLIRGVDYNGLTISKKGTVSLIR